MCRVFFCCRTSPLPFTFSTVCLFVFSLFVLYVFHFVLASSSTLFFRLSRQLKYPLIYSNTSLLERVQRELFHVVTRCLTPLMSDASCSCVYRLVLVYKILFIWIFLFFTSHSSFTLMMLCDSGLRSCSQLVSSLTIRVLIMKNYVQHLHTLFLSSGTSHTWTLQLCDFVSFFFTSLTFHLISHAMHTQNVYGVGGLSVGVN